MSNTYRVYFRRPADCYFSVTGRNAREAVRNAKAVAHKLYRVAHPVVTRVQRLCGGFERDLRVRS